MSKKDAKVMAKLLLKVTISGGREIIIWGIPDYDSVINGKWNVPSTTDSLPRYFFVGLQKNL